MTQSGFAEALGMMRDMSFIFMALFFSVIVFIVFKKLNSVLNSLKNTLHSTPAPDAHHGVGPSHLELFITRDVLAIHA